MTDRSDFDGYVSAWLGSRWSDIAPARLVEAVLEPIPHLPQHRPWRARLLAPGMSRGARRTVAGALLLAVTAMCAGIVGFGLGLRGSGDQSSSAGAVPTVGAMPTPAPQPVFRMTLDGGTLNGTFVSDPTAPVATCDEPETGAWSYLYDGGTPFTTLDVVIPDGRRTVNGSDAVALELQIGEDYSIKFDPSQVRGGDAPGRSRASVSVDRGVGQTTVRIHAVTPDTSGIMLQDVTFDFVLVCYH